MTARASERRPVPVSWSVSRSALVARYGLDEGRATALWERASWRAMTSRRSAALLLASIGIPTVLLFGTDLPPWLAFCVMGSLTSSLAVVVGRSRARLIENALRHATQGGHD